MRARPTLFCAALASGRSALLAAMDLALPAECAGCGLLPGLLCGALAGSVRAALASTEDEVATPGLAAAGSAAGVVLVPMPSRRGAVRDRGRDPTLALARQAARLLRSEGADVSVRPVLRMAGTVQDQSGLDAQARAANLRGAVLLPDRWVARLFHDGSRVVLVDDIITTGASLAAAADTLRRAGIEIAGAALVAATRRRTP